jgi:hypothetical protein
LRLAPVGTPVSLRRSAAPSGAGLAALLPGWTVGLYDSGTAALAVALQDARLRHPAQRPEAIVPAYGCPQLISACLYAQVRPRLVDTAPGEWGYAPEALRAALGPDTVAVLAVNLLGVGDQAAELLPLAHANGSRLIQDSAQHLPVNAPRSWCGDYVVLSFGRGKPLNLLRGGALAVRAGQVLQADAPELSGARERLKETLLGSRLAGVAFNVLTQPHVYAIAARLPGLRVGATRYDGVERITRLPAAMWRQVAPAYAGYTQAVRELVWSPVLHEWESLGLRILGCHGAVSAPTAGRLRLALLADSRELRDRVVTELDRRGFGVSTFYGAALHELISIPSVVSEQGPFPNAMALADRLLTLPTHRFVSDAVVRRAHESVLSVCSRGREGTLQRAP